MIEQKFTEDPSSLIYGINPLPLRMAKALEAKCGIQSGTQDSLKCIKINLEQQLEDIEAAMDLLQDERHAVPKGWLNLAIGLYREALEDVQKQLQTDGYLPSGGR